MRLIAATCLCLVLATGAYAESPKSAPPPADPKALAAENTKLKVQVANDQVQIAFLRAAINVLQQQRNGLADQVVDLGARAATTPQK